MIYKLIFLKDPSRVTTNSSTLIDHIYTNFDDNIAHVYVYKISLSYHYAVFGKHRINNFYRTRYILNMCLTIPYETSGLL